MLRALLLAPFLLVLIAFALSNPQPVSLALWPTDVTLEAPLSIATLVIAGVFFLLGGIITWLPALRVRRRARLAEKRARALESELAARDKAAAAPMVPVSLALWPTDVTLEAPLSIATLIIAAVFFLLGGIITWLPALRVRRRARLAEKRARALESELAARDKAAAAPMVPVANRLSGPPVIQAARVR